ncbi:MAG: endolytic transglycosylase MltG [Candidatus Paceibacteria bacterium]
MITPVKKAGRTRWYHTRLILLTFIAYGLGGWFLYTHEALHFITYNPILKTETVITPFPISVNPLTKTIADHPELDFFITTEIASNHTPPRRAQSLFALLKEEIITHQWYQQLASPISRTLVIYSGQRNEEITDAFAKILRWNSEEKDTFMELATSLPPSYSDGILYPGRYYVERDSGPELVIKNITNRFDEMVRSRYTAEIEAVVPLADALIIASLIEREAYDFTDMREISGVIWNRLFIDMPLQLDATLQYVRGSNPHERWWPVPRPADKFLDSPYNTYQNKGLPPTPIANPSIDAIIAALNPISTDCIFYFHTPNGGFYCTTTYEEHVRMLREKFGQGS